MEWGKSRLVKGAKGRRGQGEQRSEKGVGKHRVPKTCGKRRARTSPEGRGCRGSLGGGEGQRDAEEWGGTGGPRRGEGVG